jgi:hypothetical protein
MSDQLCFVIFCNAQYWLSSVIHKIMLRAQMFSGIYFRECVLGHVLALSVSAGVLISKQSRATIPHSYPTLTRGLLNLFAKAFTRARFYYAVP